MGRERSPPSPRLLTVPRSPRVARCLFGAPDSKDVSELAREEIEKEQKRLSEKYNFDFETDTPLEGNFVYEPIEDVPACLLETSNTPKKTPEDVAQRKLTEFMGVTKPSKQIQRKRRTEDDNGVREEARQVACKSPRIESVA